MGDGREDGVDELISSGEKLQGRFRKITRPPSFSGRREYHNRLTALKFSFEG
jgi:hypothetical protein